MPKQVLISDLSATCLHHACEHKEALIRTLISAGKDVQLHSKAHYHQGEYGECLRLHMAIEKARELGYE